MNTNLVRWKLRQARLKRLVSDSNGSLRVMRQEDAAREIAARYHVNIGACYFGMIERGEKTGSVKVMKAIAHFFGLEIEDVL